MQPRSALSTVADHLADECRTSPDGGHAINRTRDQPDALPNCAFLRSSAAPLRSAATALPAPRSGLEGPLTRERRARGSIVPIDPVWLIRHSGLTDAERDAGLRTAPAWHKQGGEL
jgi:hypothetical protein